MINRWVNPQPRVPSKEPGAAGTVESCTGPLSSIWTDGAYQPFDCYKFMIVMAGPIKWGLSRLSILIVLLM